MDDIAGSMREVSHNDALKHLLSISDANRLHELAMTQDSLTNWVDVAYSLQSSAVDYDPTGSVACLDIFVCEPLKALEMSKHEWRVGPLSRWQKHCPDVKYHDVLGTHYTMLSPESVGSFAKIFRRAMTERAA